MKELIRQPEKRGKLVGMILLMTGVLFVVGFQLLTWYDLTRLGNVADKALAFTQERVQTFTDFKENDKIKSLYRLLDKTTELSRQLAEGKADSEQFLEQYIYEQRIDGVLILDEELGCVKQMGEPVDAYAFWTDTFCSKTIRDMIAYPKKSFLTRVEKEGETYDLAVVSRRDEKGLILCYVQKSNTEGMDGDISMKKLLGGFTFEMKGIAVVTDGKRIVTTNAKQLQQQAVSQCSELYDGSFAMDRHGLFHVKGADESWYGKTKRMKGYQIYVCFPASAVFAFRTKVFLIGIVSSFSVWILLSKLRERMVRSNMRQLEEYQKRLKESAEQAERANIAKTDFLRRMSHDVRTPINGIRGMVEICRYYMGNEKKQAECLDKIMISSGFLLDLVNDALDMNKLESGKIYFEHKPFMLSLVLRDVETMVEAQAREQGIRFEVEEVAVTHEHLVGSVLHLRQILQNLVSNAIKYNKPGGKVTVWCRETDCWEERSAVMEFVIADTGQGMSEEFQKHAFEPFAQEKETARTDYQGTGLGLAITKKLVEQMKGAIRFVSKQGIGTTFTVCIPFDVDTSGKKEEIGGKVPIEEALAGLRILVVEDNQTNMEIAHFMLEHAGAEVVEAYNGKEAVTILEGSEPDSIDVVLMDIMMPVMNGLEAARRIRSSNRSDIREVAIIAMSANAFADDVQRSYEAGMNYHLSKPIELEQVVEAVAQSRR